MVIGEASINNIMGGIENTGTVRLHNHKRKLKQRFVIIKKLGQGTYGKVQLGVNKETGQEVAIKTIKKSKIETEADLIRIRREIQIMSSVQHPNIIHIYEVFENREKMVLVMEYAAGGELYDYLSERKVLVESEARRIFRQIATACFYCHKHKICHRDLKLENILLDENGNAKIADFGLSNVFDESRLLSTFCGSPLYASPEIVKGTPYVGPEVDCWSLGVLLYTLVYGAMPFDGSNFKRLVRQISAADYSEPARPSPASPLIREMLAVDPTTRASIERVCAHWWVNEGQEEQCLVQAEALAAQTPVRLDLLLALAPPADNLRDKLVVTDIADELSKPPESVQPIPTRSQSVGSIMELTGSAIIPPAERRIKDLLHSTTQQEQERQTTAIIPTISPLNNAQGATPKRKLEPSVSASSTGSPGMVGPVSQSKQKLAKESTVADVTGKCINVVGMDTSGEELNKSDAKVVLSEIDFKDKGNRASSMEVAEDDDNVLQGAACKEILNEQEAKKQTEKVEIPSELRDKENANAAAKLVAKTATKKLVKKKVLGDNNVEESANNAISPEKKVFKKFIKPKNSMSSINEKSATVKTELPSNSTISSDSIETASTTSPTLANGDIPSKKVIEKFSDIEEKEKDTAIKPSPSASRRRSTIFEQAEKFQSLLAPTESKISSVVADKPKKIIIPGVSVGGFKREFERKASLTSTSPPKLKTTPTKKLVINDRSTSIDKDEEVVDEDKSVGLKPTSLVNKSVPSKSKIIAQPATATTSQMTSPTTSSTKSSPTSVSSTSNSSTVSQPTSTAVATTQTPTKTTSATSPTAPAALSLSTLTEVTAGKTSAAISADAMGTGTRAIQVKNAVSIISSALEEGARKSRSRPCMMQPGAGRKPPVPFGIGGRSATCSMAGGVPSTVNKRELFKMHSIPATSSPHQSTQTSPVSDISNDDIQQTSSAEITLKSATLPRRKMTKAEIQLNYPQQQQPVIHPQMEFRTEMAHRVENPPQAPQQQHPRKVQTQRSDITFPVYGPTTKIGLRSASLEPEPHLTQQSTKERIIPISLEREDQHHGAPSPPIKPPTPRASFTSQKSNISQRTNSTLSRQSTLDSESGNDTVSESLGGEAIRKSAREYIIPIAVEGGGYVTPRATSLEPQQEVVGGSGSSSTIGGLNPSRGSTFSRRWKSAFADRDGSEDEDRVGFSPFQRYTSLGKDSDSEDRDPFHMHRLRSSRPYKATLEHTDSVSSGEDDDDDGFETLTAENLFSTLLSRVRDLTQRLKVDDSIGRPGFPTSRLLSQFDHGTNFFSNVHPPLTRNSPLGRSFNREHSVTSSMSGGSTTTSAQPHWRRSVSRDLAHDIQSVFGERQGPVCDAGFHPTVTATLPRGDNKISTSSTSDGLNLKDFNQQLKNVKLTEEDALALSYLTPGLSRRIQKQLFAQLSCPDGQTQRAGSSTLPRRRSSMTQRTITVDSSQNKLAESNSLGKLRYQSALSENLRKETTVGDTQTRPQTRRVSRFLRPDFYDNTPSTANSITTNSSKTENLFYKEKKERELETQKVLKEIRDKRIKNRLNVRREKSMSREKDTAPSASAEILMNYTKTVESKSTIPTYVNDSVVQELTVSNNFEELKRENNTKQENTILDNVDVPSEKSTATKKERISKLVRPKSYPNEKAVKSSEDSLNQASIKSVATVVNNKSERSLKFPETYSIDSKAIKGKTTKSSSGTKNKFLQTIEKKFEKFRSLNQNNSNTDETTPKEESNKKSCVESAIRKLREHSVPKQIDDIVTESTLIKRAVSVEDCTTNQAALMLQPSRKSVTKILGLFKKYEDKEKLAKQLHEGIQMPENNPITPVILLNEISETNIPRPKKMTELVKAKSPDSIMEPHRERPKSLMIDSNVNLNKNGHNNETIEGIYKSRLPLMSINRRSLQIEDNAHPTLNNNSTSPAITPTSTISSDRIQFSENSIINDIAQRRADQRVHLQLDMNLSNSTVQTRNNLLTPDDTTSSCTLLSPCDDTISCSGDSNWSLCSDLAQGQQQPSMESNGNDADILGCDSSTGESVIDRIRRKSFYSRFNDQRRSRKTSLGSGCGLVGSYRDLDLYRYRDYNQPTPSTSSNPHKRAYSRSSSHILPDYSTLTNSNEFTSSFDRKREYRPYGRSGSMLHEYVNMPSSSSCRTGHNNNPRLLSYTRLYHDDNNAINNGNDQVGDMGNGCLDDLEDDSSVGKLGNIYARCNYSPSSRQNSHASTRSSVSPSPSIEHVHDQPITANNNLKLSACLHSDKY